MGKCPACFAMTHHFFGRLVHIVQLRPQLKHAPDGEQNHFSVLHDGRIIVSLCFRFLSSESHVIKPAAGEEGVFVSIGFCSVHLLRQVFGARLVKIRTSNQGLKSGIFKALNQTITIKTRASIYTNPTAKGV